MHTTYIEIETGIRSLTLTPDHFVPVALDAKATWPQHMMKRARDVVAGMHVFLPGSEDSVKPMFVKAVRNKIMRGAFNPYTLGGTVVVDGVVASAHSSWLLDPVLDAFHATHLIPSTYQVRPC